MCFARGAAWLAARIQRYNGYNQFYPAAQVHDVMEEPKRERARERESERERPDTEVFFRHSNWLKSAKKNFHDVHRLQLHIFLVLL